jgi:hypothetical protein
MHRKEVFTILYTCGQYRNKANWDINDEFEMVFSRPSRAGHDTAFFIITVKGRSRISLQHLMGLLYNIPITEETKDRQNGYYSVVHKDVNDFATFDMQLLLPFRDVWVDFDEAKALASEFRITKTT